MDISPKSTLKIRCTGNMQALFHSLEKSKLSFNAEHSELLLLNVPLHCHNFSAMFFTSLKLVLDAPSLGGYAYYIIYQ